MAFSLLSALRGSVGLAEARIRQIAAMPVLCCSSLFTFLQGEPFLPHDVGKGDWRGLTAPLTWDHGKQCSVD